MDALQILERYFKTFIEQDDAKAFFIGMTDYLNYGDAVPEYDWITTQISSMPKAQMDKLDKQNKIALEKVRVAHDEIASYITKKKIDTPAVHHALQECQAIFDGRVHGNMPLPYMLHLRLYDILRELYSMPKHKNFASKHIVFSERDKTQPHQYLPIKELDDLMETENELERGSDDAIWGIQTHIYHLRDVVNKGREIGKGITERIKKQESGATLDMLNFAVLMGEWIKIEEEKQYGIPNHARPIFFSPKKVRPQVQRFHMYVLAHFSEAHNALAQASPKTDILAFDENTAQLSVKGKDFRIRRVSDQYDLLRVIFSDPSETDKEWFFDEIATKVDHARPQERIKKYYNAAYQICIKLATKGIPSFFITTRHSVRINPIYLS